MSIDDAQYTPLKAWAERYNIPHGEAYNLHRYVLSRFDQQVASSNGYPHVTVANKNDKSANSEAWEKDSNTCLTLIDSICLRNNLQYDPGTGLWGSFKRDGHYIGDMPDCSDD